MATVDRYSRESDISNGLCIPTHDDIQMTYTGDNLTLVEYFRGGEKVAELTMVYDGDGNNTRIYRSDVFTP